LCQQKTSSQQAPDVKKHTEGQEQDSQVPRTEAASICSSVCDQPGNVVRTATSVFILNTLSTCAVAASVQQVYLHNTSYTLLNPVISSLYNYDIF